MHEIIWDMNDTDELMFCGDPRVFPYGYGTFADLTSQGMATGALGSQCIETNPSDGSTCTENWDPIVALAACPFVTDYCTNTQEFTKEITEMPSVITISYMQDSFSCTYKVASTTGAPGFEFDVSMFSMLDIWDDGSRP